jgi:hypothetical protein
MPDNAMAWAMMGYSLLRLADYQALVVPTETRDEIVDAVDRALALDQRSYFARTIKAVTLHDLLGDAWGAREQAAEAAETNDDFLPTKAMLAISEIHLGDIGVGLRRLQEAIAAGPEDASVLRHRRELAIGHLLAGNAIEGVRVASRLWRDYPMMKRNALVFTGLLAAAGDSVAAHRQMQMAKAATPELSLATARLPSFGDATAAERFRTLLVQAGL